MSRIAAFMLLDFRVLPVLARIFWTVFLFLTMLAFSFGESLNKSVEFFPVMFVFISIAQQFAIMRKNRLETLYVSLPLTRDDIVKAKYLSFVCLITFVTLTPPFMMLLFYQTNENIHFPMATLFLICSFFAAVLYPIAFKTSEKTMNFIFMVTGISYVVTVRSSPGIIIPLIELSTPSVMVIVALILLYLSYLLSLRIYRNKDL